MSVILSWQGCAEARACGGGGPLLPLSSWCAFPCTKLDGDHTPVANWVSVASSADGNSLAALIQGGEAVYSSLLARAGRYMGEGHAKEQERDQAEIHSGHDQPPGWRNLKIAAFLIALFAEQKPKPGPRHQQHQHEQEVGMQDQQPGHDCRARNP